MDPREFQVLLKTEGRKLWRDMPWRDDPRPFYVLVSELMLQQTQVVRVIPKFEMFVERFPDEHSLASAPLAEVLRYWQGLGYNRRAKYLHDAAKMIVDEFDGTFPQAEADIRRLPGVGKNTAGAILAYAFNQPSIFVETNVRTVYIHHFFTDNFAVDDKEIIEKLEVTVDRQNPRQFYQNLMDYGTYLKSAGIKNNSHSKHYKKQSALKGSLREMRGEILRRISYDDVSWREELETDPRFDEALAGLVRDGLITTHNGRVRLTE